MRCRGRATGVLILSCAILAHSSLAESSRPDRLSSVVVGAGIEEVHSVLGLPDVRFETLVEDFDRLTLQDLFAPPDPAKKSVLAVLGYSEPDGGLVVLRDDIVTETIPGTLGAGPNGGPNADTDRSTVLSGIRVGMTRSEVEHVARPDTAVGASADRSIPSVFSGPPAELADCRFRVATDGMPFPSQLDVLTWNDTNGNGSTKAYFLNDLAILLIRGEADLLTRALPPLLDGACEIRPAMTDSERERLAGVTERIRTDAQSRDTASLDQLRNIGTARVAANVGGRPVETFLVPADSGSATAVRYRKRAFESTRFDVPYGFAFVPQVNPETLEVIRLMRSFGIGSSMKDVRKALGKPTFEATLGFRRGWPDGPPTPSGNYSTPDVRYREHTFVRADGLYAVFVTDRDRVIEVRDLLLPSTRDEFRQSGIRSRASLHTLLERELQRTDLMEADRR